MKLRYLGSIVSALALAVVAPACGDDSGSSDDVSTDDDEEDSGADDESTEDESTEDESTEDESTEDESTEDESTEDESTEDESTEDESTEDESTDDESTDDVDGGTDEPTDDVDGGTDEPTDSTDSGTDEPTDGEDGGTDEPTDDTDVEPEAGPACIAPEPEEEPEAADCPPEDEREIVEVSGEIEDEIWTCENSYLLTDYTYVVGGNTLTIEPGVIVYGQPETALVITRGSQIDAVGQKDAPIVFTSAALEGRSPGDWGGLHLLGAAPINTVEDQVEGIDPDEDRGTYGGDDPEHNCGMLKYVRVEFAGYEFAPDEELNGIGVAGCGSETVLDYVQVHKGSDDGIEIWGGAPQLKHILITGAQDDSLDWDAGFQGMIQYLAIQQNPAEFDAAFESDNNEDDNSLEPRSMPTIHNATIVGAGGNGLVLRRGTWAVVKNSILTEFAAAVDVRDAESVAGAELDPPALAVESSLFFNTEFAVEEGEDDDDEGFDEEAFFSAASMANQFDVDPELGDIESLTAPDFVPAAGSPAGEAADPVVGDAFFDCVEYVGAFAPGGADWTAEWTAFPEE